MVVRGSFRALKLVSGEFRVYGMLYAAGTKETSEHIRFGFVAAMVASTDSRRPSSADCSLQLVVRLSLDELESAVHKGSHNDTIS